MSELRLIKIGELKDVQMLARVGVGLRFGKFSNFLFKMTSPNCHILPELRSYRLRLHEATPNQEREVPLGLLRPLTGKQKGPR